MFQTEFEFTLPKGYLDADGNLHRKGVMRLSKAIDEIVPLRDPRVKSNPAYATVVILARVIIRLGALEEVNTAVIEGLFACDLNYLQRFYRQINELDGGDEVSPNNAKLPSEQVSEFSRYVETSTLNLSP
ncbi:hypothetical protein NIES4072_65140 [Nostoc commune NIES-4072]|uniref:Uncharacterized protein n=1 Tax=Nostoc commune NIES-4072 TaxID=2005467 RepID=A0A2R5FVM2_NOSCO|nr:hypothetical protein [Nostoc commune]BBD70149.1 hypothetical protein NIES4070_65600 [Nostoc commune HK-02]GBG22802.1 hypothetical protein NIES4072_65140 [Nostoc commune NIES-4072]